MTTSISSRERPRASRPPLHRRRSTSPDSPAFSHTHSHHLLPPMTSTLDHSRSLPSGLDEFGSLPFTPGGANGQQAPARQHPSPLVSSQTNQEVGPPALQTQQEGSRHQVGPPPLQTQQEGSRHQVGPPPLQTQQEGSRHQVGPPPLQTQQEGSRPAAGEVRRDLFGSTPFASQPQNDVFGATPFITCNHDPNTVTL